LPMTFFAIIWVTSGSEIGYLCVQTIFIAWRRGSRANAERGARDRWREFGLSLHWRRCWR
jgi:hypothetical protein